MAKNLYWKYVLTGGGTGALDAIDGDELADLDSAIVVTLSTTYLYSLDDDSGAEESSPDVIAPDLNPGTKRWILTNVTGAISTFLALSDAPASYTDQAGKFPKVNAAENALEFAESWDQQFNNLLSGGGFASWSLGTTAVPDGWTAEATPAYLRATVDVGYGSYAIRLTTDAVNEGINQTISGLKPSTKYTIQVRAKATAGDTARLFTTGATTNIDEETASTSWTDLIGTFTTDAAGANVVVKLVGKAATDIVWFCGAIAVEGAIAPAFTPRVDSLRITEELSQDPWKQQFNNIIKNGDFKIWSGGAAAAPDGWVLGGAAATIAREATIIRLGEYSAKLTRNGTDCYIYYKPVTPIDADTNTYWRGRMVTAGCWVYATVADRARIELWDGISGSQSSYHTGDSTWQFLTATITIEAAATEIRLDCDVRTGDTSAYYDGVILVEGTICPASAPKFLEDHGTVVVEVDESKMSHKLPIQIDGVDYYIMLTQT